MTRNRKLCERIEGLRVWGWALLFTLLLGCQEPGDVPRHPWVVIGVDGMEWHVIEKMWGESRLPVLRSLVEKGARTSLLTDYAASPVIWTTIATGVNPVRHGILDFVVATEKGDVPVSSSLRKVPAIWELVSREGLRVGVLGWWATWPAEEIRGPMLSDRCLQENLDDRLSPPQLLEGLDRDIEGLGAIGDRFGGNETSSRRDAIMAEWGRRWAGRDLDLLMVYFRSLDIASHRHWKGFEPSAFADLAPEEIEPSRGKVEAAYEAVDEAIGRIVEAAGPGNNVLVISDHGFKAAAHERLQIQIDLGRVLEALGFLVRDADGIDFSKSQTYPHASPNHRVAKLVRFAREGREAGGRVTKEEEGPILARLEAALQDVRWPGGEPTLLLREASPREERQGADFVIEMIPRGADRALLDGDREIAGAVVGISRLSGTHSRRTHGVLIASGPDIEPTPDAGRIRIHDVTPTLLYALGLPVAEDLDGVVAMDLFMPGFRAHQRLSRVATFGGRRALGPATSKVDERLVDELRALGYLD